MAKNIRKWLKISCLAIFTGISVIQILYAILWAVQNGDNVQDFYDTALYLERAETLTSDGWRLVGYSCILSIFLWLQKIIGENYVIVLYLFQAVISLLCFTKGCRSLTKLFLKEAISFKKALIPAGYILTLPIVWQMQFAVLPDAICVSLVVLLFATLVDLLCEKAKKRWDCVSIACGVLLLLGVLHRHYFYGAMCLVGMTVLIMLIRLVSKRYRSFKMAIVSIVLVVFVIVTPIVTTLANNSVPKAGTYATYSLEADLWKRFVFPDLLDNYPHYTERIVAIIPEYVAAACAEHYEYYMNSVGPMIEINNSEEAKSIYFELARIGFALYRQEMIEGTIKEAIAYSFMPLAMEKYMYGNGDSLYGHNYTKMYEMNPKVTADYMHIGMNGFFVISILGMIMFIVNFVVNKEHRKNMFLAIVYAAMSILCVTMPMMFFYFMKFDYRLGLFSTFIWGAWAIICCFVSVKEYDKEKVIG